MHPISGKGQVFALLLSLRKSHSAWWILEAAYTRLQMLLKSIYVMTWTAVSFFRSKGQERVLWYVQSAVQVTLTLGHRT